MAQNGKHDNLEPDPHGDDLTWHDLHALAREERRQQRSSGSGGGSGTQTSGWWA